MQTRLTSEQLKALITMIRNKKEDMPEFTIETCHLFTSLSVAIKNIRREKESVFALADESPRNLFTEPTDQGRYFIMRLHIKPITQDVPKKIFYVAISNTVKQHLATNLYKANPEHVEILYKNLPNQED